MTEENENITENTPQVDVFSPQRYTPIEKNIGEDIKSKLLSPILELLASSSKLDKPKVRFDISPEAAAHNFNLLRKENFDLERILNVPGQTSITSYGSEFKSTSELNKMFKKSSQMEGSKDETRERLKLEFKRSE